MHVHQARPTKRLEGGGDAVAPQLHHRNGIGIPGERELFFAAAALRPHGIGRLDHAGVDELVHEERHRTRREPRGLAQA